MRAPLLEAFRHYLHAQADASRPGDTPPRLALTISRETGAGAVTVAQLVADLLQQTEKAAGAKPWAVFDANLAEQVLADHNLPLRLERFMTEDARLPAESVVEEVLGLHPPHWTLVQHTTDTILRLAAMGNAILVGRGSSVIAARMHHVFHVRLVAPVTDRIAHVASYYHLDEPEASKLVRNKDEGRRRYLRRYFNAEIDDATLYDLTLNTGRLGVARTAQIIAEAAQKHRNDPHRSERAGVT
ncbi:MAG TPA: cytidylate kinase-like family protein [Chthoniobacterales bacterium]